MRPMTGGFFVRNVSRSAEANIISDHFVDGDVLTRNVQIERLLATHRARCHPAGRMASPTDLGNPSEAELGQSPRPAPPRSDEDYAAPMLGFASFGRFVPAAATASSSASSTDPPGAAPCSSIPQIHPPPLITADERPIPSSTALQRPLPLSASAEAPLLAILDDRRDLNWAWKPSPSPTRACRIPDMRRGRFTLYCPFHSAAGQT